MVAVHVDAEDLRRLKQFLSERIYVRFFFNEDVKGSIGKEEVQCLHEGERDTIIFLVHSENCK